LYGENDAGGPIPWSSTNVSPENIDNRTSDIGDPSANRNASQDSQAKEFGGK
jgi:hypothetical protein